MVIKIISTFSLLVICIFSATASAEETSTNAELQQMIMDLVANQEKLEQEQERLEQELVQVQSEATDAKQERAVTREEVAETKTAAVRIPQETDSGGYANLDFIYKRQAHDRLTYAQFVDVTTWGETRQIDIDTEYERGFRIGLGYLSSRGAEAFVNYSLLTTSADDSVEAGLIFDSDGDPVDLNGTLLVDYVVNVDPDDNLERASASYDMDYRVLDAGFAQNLDIGEHLDLRFGGGLRYASIDDNLHARYEHFRNTFLGPQLAVTETQIKNDFWGVGPRATVDTTWHIPNTGGLSIFGGLGASILYGKNEFSYLAENVGRYSVTYNDTDVVLYSKEERHLFPVVEATVGAGYSGSLDNISYDLRIGYEFETWFDALSSVDFNPDYDDEITREDTDLSLHGMFFSGNIRW